jgi:hypothetical protein
VKEEADGKDIYFSPRVVKLGEEDDEFTGHHEITTLVLDTLDTAEAKKLQNQEEERRIWGYLNCLPMPDATGVKFSDWHAGVRENIHKINDRDFRDYVAGWVRTGTVEKIPGDGSKYHPDLYRRTESGEKWLEKNTPK